MGILHLARVAPFAALVCWARFGRIQRPKSRLARAVGASQFSREALEARRYPYRDPPRKNSPIGFLHGIFGRFDSSGARCSFPARRGFGAPVIVDPSLFVASKRRECQDQTRPKISLSLNRCHPSSLLSAAFFTLWSASSARLRTKFSGVAGFFATVSLTFQAQS